VNPESRGTVKTCNFHHVRTAEKNRRDSHPVSRNYLQAQQRVQTKENVARKENEWARQSHPWCGRKGVMGKKKPGRGEGKGKKGERESTGPRRTQTAFTLVVSE